MQNASMNRSTATASVAALTLVAAAASADSFRCGTRLVTDGDPAAKVQALCGLPTELRRSAILRRPTVWIGGRPYALADGMSVVSVEIWTYNLGPHRLMRELRFEDGILVDIRSLGHGYDDPRS